MGNLKVEKIGSGNKYRVYIDEDTKEIVATVYPSGQPNHPQLKTTKLRIVEFLVKKMEGPFTEGGELVEEMFSGKTYVFKATKFSQDVTLIEKLKKVKWSVEIDDCGELNDLPQSEAYIEGDDICYKYTPRKCERVRIYAYCNSPSKGVSIQTELVVFPMAIARSMRRAGVVKDSQGSDVTKEDITNLGFQLPADRIKMLTRLNQAYEEAYGITVGNDEDKIEERDNIVEYAMKQIEKYNVHSDDKLFDIFKNDADDWAMGDLDDCLHDMIDFFQNNTKTINFFEDPRLNKAIASHNSTENFISGLAPILSDAIRRNTGISNALKVDDMITQYVRNEIEEKPDMLGLNLQDLNSLSYPDKFGGLGITIDGTQAFNIYLNEFDLDGDAYQGKIQLEILDHYGLDSPDILKKFIRKHEEFTAWYILQHLRDYKPFITKIRLNYTFTGELYSENLTIRLNEEEN
ncbi:DUF3289 family protein [Rapidithrix thailandica]|uniref:DUF3289 family protein n=1 Tax=Rapidithrix thailandica TaxID=413964 RepID=A0AAW9SD35_9BACT